MPSAPALPSAPSDAARRSQARVSAARRRPARRAQALPRALGLLGLLGVGVTVFLTCAGAAGEPSQYVPGRSGGWPPWLAGPLEGLHMSIGSGGFQTLTLIMCASYLLVLALARTLPMWAIVATIVVAHAILLLGPPLISQDVFGYLGFARLGALHGLDPYTHVAAQAPGDEVFWFVGWPYQHSPYGPLFTLASYATAPLGLAGGLWAFKAVAVASSLAAIALVARAAGKLGHSRRWAAAFVGLNPVLLVLAVGGAHNDTLLMMLLAAALALTAGASPRFRTAAATLVVGVGIKVTAGLVLAFLVLAPGRWRERRQVAAAAALSLLALGAVGLIGFGSHALGFLNAVGEQQQLVAVHSVPAETARLLGLHGTPDWWRNIFAGLFVLVLAYSLWRTARGADWRVAAGWATLALLLSTAWLLPWYAIWLLPLAAVGGDRRLRAATLLFCAYAVLIHLPLADPLLVPARPRIHKPVLVVHRDRVDLARFQVVHDPLLDLGR
ncbi:MAG TPA: glycosyltransferase 87 family protein [Solirubrobacteraceae bacterium]|nr:glycosyltransferase 87 family protein [Solirubrobacteraceae bacterium]